MTSAAVAAGLVYVLQHIQTSIAGHTNFVQINEKRSSSSQYHDTTPTPAEKIWGAREA